MTEKEHTIAAFPTLERGVHGIELTDPGMTLRDYFAAHAAAGMCAAFPNVSLKNTEQFLQSVPTTAYEIADAMLEARKK